MNEELNIVLFHVEVNMSSFSLRKKQLPLVSCWRMKLYVPFPMGSGMHRRILCVQTLWTVLVLA